MKSGDSNACEKSRIALAYARSIPATASCADDQQSGNPLEFAVASLPTLPGSPDRLWPIALGANDADGALGAAPLVPDGAVVAALFAFAA